MKSRKISILLSLSAALVASVAMGGSPAMAQNTKISIMVGGIDKQIYLPAELAVQLGYFKDEGIDVTVLDEPSGVAAEDELLAGRVDGAVGFYDHTIDMQGLGKSVESVVQFDRYPGEVELVATKQADKIKSPADFKGKNLGITGHGSSTEFLTWYMAVKAGLKISDVTTVPVGAGNTFIAAIQQGTIDAGMTTEPTVDRELVSGDAKILVDMRTQAGTVAALGGTYPAACLYMQTDWVNAHKADVQKIVNVFVKTMRWIHSHSAAEIADKMPADYYAGNKDLYVNALIGSMDMYTPDGKMPADGPATVLKVQQTFNPHIKDKTIDLSATFTDEYVDKANAALGPLPTAAATEGASNVAAATMAATKAQ